MKYDENESREGRKVPNKSFILQLLLADIGCKNKQLLFLIVYGQRIGWRPTLKGDEEHVRNTS